MVLSPSLWALGPGPREGWRQGRFPKLCRREPFPFQFLLWKKENGFIILSSGELREMGAEGVWEDVPPLRRVFQLLLIGRKGEDGSKEEGWEKVEHDPVCQGQRQ